MAAITHSFILFSFFPLSGYYALFLLNNSEDNDYATTSTAKAVTVNNVGLYAGMLGSVFTLGRFLGFVPWKFIRSTLGEKHALTLSLFLTGLSSGT